MLDQQPGAPSGPLGEERAGMSYADYRAYVSRAVSECLQVLGRVARGDFESYCAFDSEDELGALALGINLVVSELRENAQLKRVVSLEQKLRDKADQLSRTVTSLLAANEELEHYKERIEEQNRTLEQKVRDRTEELVQLNAQLQCSNQELNDFTYVVSHDLKEPLRAIEAFSSFIRQDYAERLDEEGKGYLERIRVNTRRLQEFIEDLLELSRIGRVRNPYETIDLRGIVDKVTEALSLPIAEKQAMVVVKGEWPRAFADRTRVYQVFFNLIDNALKFSADRAPMVEVEYRDAGADHAFRVKDNGIGIEAQYFDRIFLVFQRLHSRDTYAGSGAGLTICKKIVELHGGKIWLESELGAGTTFHFTLPKQPAPSTQA
jgi:light-regulated signal transduction histidine kinase (bacteriophytochrome)